MNLSFPSKLICAYLLASSFITSQTNAAALGETSGNNKNKRARQLKKDGRKGTKSPKASKSPKETKPPKSDSSSYEVWAADQSNSVPGQIGKGMKGSYIWIWDSESMTDYLKSSSPEQEDAKPISCTPNDEFGPCDLLDVFPQDLTSCKKDNICDVTPLANMPYLGRLHGVLVDPSGRYVTANIFAPGGGYVGIIDTKTKEAIALFRVTDVDATTVGRSVHLSTWTKDGSAILIANLHAKMIERIDVVRDEDGIITDLNFNIGAGVYMGKDFDVENEASYFVGSNAFGNPLIGSVIGSYDDANVGDLTPSGACKESGCSDGADIVGGSRPNNVPITPVPTANGHAYVTLGGGGLLVLKTDTSPMQIIGEYGNAVVNGAGVVGHEVGNKVFIESGVSASGAGSTQSIFSLYVFDDNLFLPSGGAVQQNVPAPIQAFKDPNNTNTGGNVDNLSTIDITGQIPQSSTRRDAHGLWPTIDGKYIHINDRIQNVVEVFDAKTYELVNTYDLVSADGKSGRYGPSGPCRAVSVTDDAGLVLNDPAPDLMEISPDGKYFILAFRGPAPVTVAHAAQGSCPGVGIVEITENGRSGKLVGVLRTTNTVDNVEAGTMEGGHPYSGSERSDPHYAITVPKWD